MDGCHGGLVGWLRSALRESYIADGQQNKMVKWSKKPKNASHVYYAVRSGRSSRQLSHLNLARSLALQGRHLLTASLIESDSNSAWKSVSQSVTMNGRTEPSHFFLLSH